MNIKLLLGLVLIVVAAVLLYFGYTASRSFGWQVQGTSMGVLTDPATWYFVSGGVAAMAGWILLTLRIRVKTHDLTDLRRTYLDPHGLTDLRRTGVTPVDSYNLTRR